MSKKNYKKFICYFLIIIYIFTFFSNHTFAETNESTITTFRVAAYNIGNFSCGKSANGAGTDKMANSLNNFFKVTNADVYLISEWDKYFNRTDLVEAKDKISNLTQGYNFSKKTGFDNYEEEEGYYYSQMNMFKSTSTNEEWHFYTISNNTYSFLDNVITINGNDIHFISTHLSWNSENNRRAQINELISYITNNNIEYFVIGGDFNMGYDGNDFKYETVLADIKQFTNEGYLSAQGNSLFGDFVETDNENKEYHLFDTWHNDTNIPIDDIILSNNLFFKSIFTYGENTSSDHLALVADIGIVDETNQDINEQELNSSITNVSVNTSVEQLITSISSPKLLAIFDSNSNNYLPNDVLLKTKDKVKLENNPNDYSVVVKGDVSGLGYITNEGIKTTAKHIIEKNIITDNEYELAADYNNDGNIKMNDVMMMLNNVITGWHECNNYKYYYDQNGNRITGFRTINDNLYYFDQNGRMQLGWKKDGSYWYYFSDTGAAAIGFKQIDNKQYYFDENGKMQLEWLHIDGHWYYFDKSTGGAMTTGLKQITYNGVTSWYYFNESGQMQLGLKEINGKWYYFDKSKGGAMVSNTCIDIDSSEYCFDANGICTSGNQCES